MNQPPSSDQATYEFQVKGHLSERWAFHFQGLELTTGFAVDGIPITTMSGPIVDQSALHGVITKIRDLGLQLRGVNRVNPKPETTNS